ncbi:Tryptophan rich basic protein [Nesidiocoris tenuis]|uniref:Guided entry of tail-anchored proteins factor 1 n=1 Tax=Nesidiocoris tenuis TaxID=355587 RepID=A0ABN7AL84_9HEMI|nr:Tryptophan rich basic protein [Nesidiocoris tenuis]
MFVLLASIVASVFNYCLPDYAEKVGRWLVRAPNTTAPEEIATVRRQLEEINPKEEFAKYARLKRQLDKLKDDYKAEARTTAGRKWKYGFAARYGAQFMMTIACMVLFYMYRSTPVVILREEWLEPFTGILSFPTYVPGALSFPVWFLVCNTVVKLAFSCDNLQLK